MDNCFAKISKPKNEEVLSYIKGSVERIEIEKELKKQEENIVEVPIIINGKEIKTNNIKEIRCPHNHKKIIAKVHLASKKEIIESIESALEARKYWAKLNWQDRASIFLKAATLLSTSFRHKLNAATMLGQSKTIHQAEIDAACELIDFWRFNSYYLQKIYEDQPSSSSSVWNRVQYRPLEGFILAITPFNFTSIGGNLPTAPIIAGNVSVWKPAVNASLSSYYIMKILKEAGLPDGVLNFVPGRGREIGKYALENENLAGIHFTGSTAVFKSMWKTIGDNIEKYKYYPRIVGETGGKDYIFACSDCDIDKLVTALLRGAFEYQGQKCSAASRAYIPKKISDKVIEKLKKQTEEIKMGDVKDFSNFISAVIDEKAFDKIKSYIDFAKNSKDAKIISGGNTNKEKGFFIEPTIIKTSNPFFKTMTEEIFGPVLTIYVYEENKIEETIDALNKSIYALTGAIFAKDREIINKLTKKLEDSAGNYYINDKPTGAVVGQQPFGGLRASGTNDKAGSYLNMIRWMSPRTIKENFNSETNFRYPFMD
jgi:1-pyrroline-5-carboxylate dehydrogenase